MPHIPHYQDNNLSGALLINKPAGPTSHDVVDIIRGQYGTKKIGHCGTLDPAATGLLVLLIGKATKLSNKLTAEHKTYEGTIELGTITDSYDAQGTVISKGDIPNLNCEDLNTHTQNFKGDIQQKPPMVSAVKKNGVPLYKLARKGKTIEREPKSVHIFSFDFLDYNTPVGRFCIHCSKGTYVRSLAHELGQQLGCGGHLRTLHRTKSGSFDIKDSIKLEELVLLSDLELHSRILPLKELTRSLQSV
tara:strand:+ start:2951 stop:3691 length:741 start_codon:yes stop_codon:yes gene_type:complete